MYKYKLQWMNEYANYIGKWTQELKYIVFVVIKISEINIHKLTQKLKTYDINNE